MFGFDTRQWKCARAQVYEALAQQARMGAPIRYSDLTDKITAIRLDMNIQKDRTALGWLLGDVSRETHRHGIGMLSAMAILKEENLPARPFFRLATELEYRFTDPVEFWLQQCQRVKEHYSRTR